MNLLERLRELERQATEGPWDVRGTPTYDWSVEHADGLLIAESRNALPALLAVVEAAQELKSAGIGVDFKYCGREFAALWEALVPLTTDNSLAPPKAEA